MPWSIVLLKVLCVIRPKKSSLFFRKLAGRKIFHYLPARISRMCMRIYIFCFKKTHAKKFPLGNLFVGIYVFFPSNSKREGALFVNKEKCCLSSFFKCKLCLENSIKLIKKNFPAARVKIISSPAFPETRVLFFCTHIQSKITLCFSIFYILTWEGLDHWCLDISTIFNLSDGFNAIKQIVIFTSSAKLSILNGPPRPILIQFSLILFWKYFFKKYF